MVAVYLFQTRQLFFGGGRDFVHMVYYMYSVSRANVIINISREREKQ